MKPSDRSPADGTRASRRRGFTIAELLVALIIAALVLVAVSTSVSRIGRARELAQARLAAHQRAIDALEAIRRDLNSTLRDEDLFLARLAIAEGSVQTRAGMLDRSELLVFSTRLLPVRDILYNGEGLEYETQYRVAEDGEGSALWRRRDPVPDDTPEGGGVAEAVADGVLGVAFEAYDGESWWPSWDSDEDGLPLAVRATVFVSGAAPDQDPAKVPELTVALRTIVPIDRVPAPRDEEAELLARQAMAAEALAEAGPGGAAGAAGLGARGEGAGMMAPEGGRPAMDPAMAEERAARKAEMDNRSGGLRTGPPSGAARGGGGGGRGGGGGAGGRGGGGGGGGGGMGAR